MAHAANVLNCLIPITQFNRGQAARIFDRLHKEMNGSVVVISHQERILNIADRIVVIAGGEVLTQAASEELLPKILSDSLGCLYHKDAEGLSAYRKDGE